MEPSPATRCALIITQPVGVSDAAHFVPMEARTPQSFVAALFHRRAMDRDDFLKRLRSSAGSPLPDEANREACTARLAAEYRTLRQAGDHEATIETAVRWWARVEGAIYHAYRLRAGVDPYSCSCLVAFDELDGAALRANAATAVGRLDAERRRVMRSFGFEWPGA
ncbi:MAG TPA: hypothetical protein VLH79_00730 [Chthonomonadales bacterium]|nr:hypothetical protein [Chthonomonadales bacterium]